MDPLTHVFLPLLVAYVLWPEYFPDWRYLAIGGFGLLPDLDKVLGVPGLLHSLLTTVPICVGLVGLDRWRNGELGYGALVGGFVLAHLFLDLLDGSGLYALYPLTDAGLALRFPLGVRFGEFPGIRFVGAPVELAVETAPTGFAESESVERNEFGFLDPNGIATALAFLWIYVGDRWGRSGSTASEPRTDRAEPGTDRTGAGADRIDAARTDADRTDASAGSTIDASAGSTIDASAGSGSGGSAGSDSGGSADATVEDAGDPA